MTTDPDADLGWVFRTARHLQLRAAIISIRTAEP
jgi:hypothetical protein